GRCRSHPRPHRLAGGLHRAAGDLVTCPNQMSSSHWTRSRSWYRCRISATASGYTPSATDGRISSDRSAKSYATRPRCYRLAGPRWQGQVRSVSSSTLANAIPRVFLSDTAADRAAIRPLINQIVVCPLAEFDEQMKSMDYAAW